MNNLQTSMNPSQLCRLAVFITLFCAGFGLAGCGEATDSQNDPASRRAQPVSLTPEFSVVGADANDDVIRFGEMNLSISEIRLEPLEQDDERSPAFSTRRPVQLHFDMIEEETPRVVDQIDVPNPGRYLVSVRLEPLTRVERNLYGIVTETNYPSLSVQGFIAAESVEVQKDLKDEQADGSPVPMPFDEMQADCAGGPCDGWMPFKFDSRRASFLTLNEIEVQRNSDLLAFEFDVSRWAEDLVEPIRAVVEEKHASAEPNQEVDVTNDVEGAGFGAESMLRGARVSSLVQVR